MLRYFFLTIAIVLMFSCTLFSQDNYPQIGEITFTEEGESLMQSIRNASRVGQTFTSPEKRKELISIGIKLTTEPANGGLLAFDLYKLEGTNLEFVASSATKGYQVDKVNELHFPNGVYLEPSTQYAFLCRNGGWNLFHAAGTSGNSYSGGNAFICESASNDPYNVNYHPKTDFDLYFKVKYIDPCDRAGGGITIQPIAENNLENSSVHFNAGRSSIVGQTFSTGEHAPHIEGIQIKLNGELGGGGTLAFDLYKRESNGFVFVSSTETKGYYLNKRNTRRFKDDFYLDPNSTYAFICRTGGLNYFGISASKNDNYDGGTAFTLPSLPEGEGPHNFELSGQPGKDLVFKILKKEAVFHLLNESDHSISLKYIVPGSSEKLDFGTVNTRTDNYQNTFVGSRWLIEGNTEDHNHYETIEVPIQAYRYEPPNQAGIPSYYTKTVYADGYPIVGTNNINDYALAEAKYLVHKVLFNNPKAREAMISSGSRMNVLAHNEYTSDQPENSWVFSTTEGASFWDRRARGLGGSEQDPFCSSAEENILCFPGDPYKGESILIHEFAHNIHLRGMVNIDPTFDERLMEAYTNALKKGLWAGTYASDNHHEYFAEGVQSWFDTNLEDHESSIHNHVDTREELWAYDPGLAKLVKEALGNNQWRYTLPSSRLQWHLEGYDPETAPTFQWRQPTTQEETGSSGTGN